MPTSKRGRPKFADKAGASRNPDAVIGERRIDTNAASGARLSFGAGA